MFLEEHLVLKFCKGAVHLLHQRINLRLFESNSYSLKNCSLYLCLKSKNIINGHVIYIIVVSDKIVHQFPELTSRNNFIHPSWQVFSFKNNFPTMQKAVASFIFVVKPYCFLVLFVFELCKSLLIFSLFLYLFIY